MTVSTHVLDASLGVPAAGVPVADRTVTVASFPPTAVTVTGRSGLVCAAPFTGAMVIFVSPPLPEAECDDVPPLPPPPHPAIRRTTPRIARAPLRR